MLNVMIFGTSKQLSAKNYLIPGETGTRNVYSKVCRNKIGNWCLSVFSLLASVMDVNTKAFEQTAQMTHIFTVDVYV